jgi:hypothetical protein
MVIDGEVDGIVTVTFFDGTSFDLDIPRPDGESVAHLSWGEPREVAQLCVEGNGDWQVRGLTLIDERSGAFQPLVLSDIGHFRLVHSGDVKIYENLDVLPRAFVIDAVLEELPPEVPDVANARPSRIVVYEPERVVIEAASPGILILADSWYPGWEATIDGEQVLIRPAWGILRSVELPEDGATHEVVVEYHSPPFRVGAVVSVSSLAVLCVVLMVTRWREHRSMNGEIPGNV